MTTTTHRLAALRIWIGAYAVIYLALRLPELVALTRLPAAQFRPIGVVRLALDAPLPPAVVLAATLVTLALMVALVAGAWHRVLAPLAAIALLWTTSYRNSWGMVFHTENLLVLHTAALALAPAARAWSIDAWISRRRGAGSPPATDAGWVWLLAALTTATYLLAGIAKLRLAGLGWIDGELLRNQIAIDNLRKALLGDGIAPLAATFLEHPRAFTGFSALTLVLELGAPLALLHPRIGRWWAAAAWGFHLGVVLLMNIWFTYPLLGVAFAPLLAAERPIAWGTARVARIRWIREWRSRRAGSRASLPP